MLPFIGVPHIHSPLVQAFMVEPTPNPLALFKSIRFMRYDLPVRYTPATVTIASG